MGGLEFSSGLAYDRPMKRDPSPAFSPPPPSRPKWLAALFVLAASSLAFSVAAIPPWQSPDEPTHFEYARLLARDGWRSPLRPDPALEEAIIASLSRNDFWRFVKVYPPERPPRTFLAAPFLCQAPTQIGKNPPGYYLLAAQVLRFCPRQSLVAQLYCLRLLNALLSLLTVGAVFLCAREAFGGGFFPALAAAAFAAVLPQFAVIGGSVSPDPLSNLLGALFILLTLLERRGPRRRFSGAFLVLLAGLFVSYKFLILLGAHFLLRLADLVRPPPGRGRRAALAALGAESLVLIVAYCALLWFSPSLVGIFLRRFRMLIAAVLGFPGAPAPPPGYWRWFAVMLFKSFWLYFGWLLYPAPAVLYGAWGALTGLALCGAAVRLLGGKGDEEGSRAFFRGIGPLAVLAGSVLAAYYAFWGLRSGYTTTQGRHLFLALPAWAILFVWGLTGLFPPRLRDGLCRGVFLILPLLASAAFAGSVWKVYR